MYMYLGSIPHHKRYFAFCFKLTWFLTQFDENNPFFNFSKTTNFSPSRWVLEIMLLLFCKKYGGSLPFYIQRVPNRVLWFCNWTKNVSQSCNPDGQSHSHHKCLFLVHFLNSKGLFSGWWFSQPELIHWSLCSLLGVNLSIFTPVILFISSFQSFTRMTHASHDNDFLLFNYDHGKTYFLVETGQY